MKIWNALCLSLVLVCTSAEAQEPRVFQQELIDKGAEVYSIYCVPCHGAAMDYPGGSFDLRTFPREQYARFASSVTKGKNNMPPWKDILSDQEITEIWAFVSSRRKP